MDGGVRPASRAGSPIVLPRLPRRPAKPAPVEVEELKNAHPAHDRRAVRRSAAIVGDRRRGAAGGQHRGQDGGAADWRSCRNAAPSKDAGSSSPCRKIVAHRSRAPHWQRSRRLLIAVSAMLVPIASPVAAAPIRSTPAAAWTPSSMAATATATLSPAKTPSLASSSAPTSSTIRHCT